jgi:hypothetical protein
MHSATQANGKLQPQTTCHLRECCLHGGDANDCGIPLEWLVLVYCLGGAVRVIAHDG